MKKLTVCVLSIIFSLCCLAACDFSNRRCGYDDSLSCKRYENCAVFTFDDFAIRTPASFELDRAGLGEGEIYYQVNLEEGALSIKYKDAGIIYSEELLGEFEASEAMNVNGSGGYVEGDKITVTFEATSPVSGEITIAFTEDALKAVHKDLELHEHTGELGFSDYAHWYQYTCGCETEDIAEEHLDGDLDGECDVCKYYMGIPEPECAVLYEYASWLLETGAEDVAEIKTVFEYVGVAPGSLKEIQSTADKDVIADVMKLYAYTSMTAIPKEATYIDGGSAFTVEFILTDGSVKALNFNNRNYVYTPDGGDASSIKYFRLDSVPTLQSKEYNNVKFYSAFIAYVGAGEIYVDGALTCRVPMDAFEFVRLEKPEGNEALPRCVVKTEFGDLVFLTDTVFRIDPSDGEDSSKYKLINTTINELITDFGTPIIN